MNNTFVKSIALLLFIAFPSVAMDIMPIRAAINFGASSINDLFLAGFVKDDFDAVREREKALDLKQEGSRQEANRIFFECARRGNVHAMINLGAAAKKAESLFEQKVGCCLQR